MPQEFHGQLSAQGKRFGIVLGRFNSFVSEQLLNGALDCLQRHGADADRIDVVRVPGSFEIPVAVSWLLNSGRYDAVIALGVLIRGATPHFDYIASEVTKGLGQLAMKSQVPVTYGVITADTIEQAIERAGTKAGNKGWDAALAAIEMANLKETLQKAK
ncbi:MAG: 6,7-dimethyl-8-ribityllumazine synthase [candidate division KSB1 bacterium]|nr:6,7-dimethyl-8-ribityllumazine synthase [candidate division KSB1 bacterium]MDQ7066321.1 6,7-dimethyl-8-ribityllumazine synthase [candidate division KSB1 bacterium]